MAIYAKITGAKQGAVTGGVGAQSFSGQIQVDTLEFGVGSPHDVATGQPTGKRVARPVVISKPLDRSSPMLHQACVTNETLTTVLFSYVQEGHGHKAYVTIALTNAMINNFNHEANSNGSAVEKIGFTYSKIELTWVDGGIVSVDDWMTPT